MLRHVPWQGFGRSPFERAIALQAAREPITLVGSQRQLLHRFDDLIVDPFASDQAAVWLAESRQHTIASDEDALFRAGELKQSAVLGLSRVERVVAHGPQPAREPAEHGVDDEARSQHSRLQNPQRGCIRMAPSRRIVSPFSIVFSMM